MNFLTQALNSAFDRTSAAQQKYLKNQTCGSLSSGSKMQNKNEKNHVTKHFLLSLSQFISIFIISSVGLKDDLGSTTFSLPNFVYNIPSKTFDLRIKLKTKTKQI